jgi:ABC-2 type transport system ATP-binding protein
VTRSLLAIQHLTVSRGGARVIDDLNLRLDGGVVHGVLGRAGSGKTALLDAIFGFIPSDAGTITLDGNPLRQEDVGYLPSELYFYPGISGRDYLRTICMSRPGNAILRDTDAALLLLAPDNAGARSIFADFDVEGWGRLFVLPLERAADTYAADMQRKLAVAGVLALGRPVLLLDEPADTLDAAGADLLGRLLKILSGNGRTILVTSRFAHALHAMCDTVHLLDHGAVVTDPSVEQAG